ncbi:hypothetical protein E5288_WYG005891 [Bos mutus]|uniref:Uncharacterized protein n=1 Tax=Bos mutus TaxID=72004 RepID=A0A6B0QYP6_9CETA|nr:hypothetical protein [Bos mutus]
MPGVTFQVPVTQDQGQGSSGHQPKGGSPYGHMVSALRLARSHLHTALQDVDDKRQRRAADRVYNERQHSSGSSHSTEIGAIPNTVNYVSHGQCTQRLIDPPCAANYGGTTASRLLVGSKPLSSYWRQPCSSLGRLINSIINAKRKKSPRSFLIATRACEYELQADRKQGLMPRGISEAEKKHLKSSRGQLASRGARGPGKLFISVSLGPGTMPWNIERTMTVVCTSHHLYSIATSTFNTTQGRNSKKT